MNSDPSSSKVLVARVCWELVYISYLSSWRFVSTRPVSIKNLCSWFANRVDSNQSPHLQRSHRILTAELSSLHIWAAWCDFQQCGILTSVDSDEPVQPPFKLRGSKWCLFSSLVFIEYSSDQQRLSSDCAYAQAGLSLCWWHIPHCWKSHVAAHLLFI